MKLEKWDSNRIGDQESDFRSGPLHEVYRAHACFESSPGSRLHGSMGAGSFGERPIAGHFSAPWLLGLLKIVGWKATTCSYCSFNIFGDEFFRNKKVWRLFLGCIWKLSQRCGCAEGPGGHQVPPPSIFNLEPRPNPLKNLEVAFGGKPQNRYCNKSVINLIIAILWTVFGER